MYLYDANNFQLCIIYNISEQHMSIIVYILVMPEKCILLEDVFGHKQRWSPWPLATRYIDEHIHRGSLLVQLTYAESNENESYFVVPLNYKIYGDDSIKLYCKPERVLQLNDEQFSLLLAVKQPLDRHKALDILHWVEKLQVGNSVNVTIPAIHYPVRGIIRYIGPLPGEEGTKFGMELLVSQHIYNPVILCYVCVYFRRREEKESAMEHLKTSNILNVTMTVHCL